MARSNRAQPIFQSQHGIIARAGSLNFVILSLRVVCIIRLIWYHTLTKMLEVPFVFEVYCDQIPVNLIN